MQLNIITRISKPDIFQRCLNSIKDQILRDRINLLCSIETSSNISKKDIVDYKCDLIEVPKKHRTKATKEFEGQQITSVHFPENFYINLLYQKIKMSGYVMFLDDDDILAIPNAVNIILSQMNERMDRILFWRVDIKGRIVPDDNHWNNMLNGKSPKDGQISGIGYCFHSDYIKYAQWDEWSCCDYRVASRLWNVIPDKVFYNGVLTKALQVGSLI